MADILIYPRAEAAGTAESREADVTKLEANARRAFPKDYRNFLVDFGGGFPWPADIAVTDQRLEEFLGDDIAGIFEFYRPETIADYAHGKTFSDATPADFIFVAEAFGVHVLMSMHDADFGALYGWRASGVPWGEEGNDVNTLVPFASDFPSLIRSMTDLSGESPGRRVWENGPRRSEARKVKL
jgi:hypothetical protein